MPGQPAAGSSGQVKAVKIKVRKGLASETQGRIRLSVSRKEAVAGGLGVGDDAAENAVQKSMDVRTDFLGAGSRGAGQGSLSGTQKGQPKSLELPETAPENQGEPQGPWVTLQQGRWGSAKASVDSAAATTAGTLHGFDLSGQAAAAAVPMAPAGQSCESWLTQADARVYQRDFQRQPITVMEGYGQDTELAGCAVPCKMVGGGPGQPAEGMPSYDAHFGPAAGAAPGTGLSVVRNMESMSNYPGLAVERARYDGYDIVMTTRLDSDVPASYLSWAGGRLNFFY